MTRIAILSDTHNLLRPEVIEYLRRCDYILHGGDISRQEILDRLEAIAPVKAVRGNNDKEWAEELPQYLDFELAGLHFYMTHKKKDLPEDLSPYDIAVIGHSHQYRDTWVGHKNGHRTLILNPGSCGPRRFHQAITLSFLTVDENGWTAERIEIPHEKTVRKDADISDMIPVIRKCLENNRDIRKQAEKRGYDLELTDQISRLILTHHHASDHEIMDKMGL